MWDQHLHSRFSADSDAELTEIVKEAKKKGLSGICFTEHIDIDYPQTEEEIDFSVDFPDYFAALDALKEEDSKSTSPLQLHRGIELGLQNSPQVIAGNLAIAKEQPLDFVIGSLHVIHGQDPYYGHYFENKTKKEACEEYFLCTLENIRAFTDFDVLGHLDYMMRYCPAELLSTSKDASIYTYADYADILDEILKTLIHTGRGLEINTGGLRKGLSFTHPIPEVIRRYHELGGEIITLGSDAHKPEDIGADLDTAARVAKECGFTHYAVFTNRKPSFLPL